MDQQSSNTILTDDRVIAITITIITTMATLLLLLLKWAINKVMAEIKSYRTDSLKQNVEFTNELKNKYKALNYYMRQTDKLQIQHSEKLNVFHEHARETKEKLIAHNDKLEKHSEQLYKHEMELQNLKKG